MSESDETTVSADGDATSKDETAGPASARAIAAIEYETLAFARHATTAVGRSRHNEPLLDGSAYTLLNLIAVGGPATIGDLAAITGLDASTLNRQTAALIERGLVLRTSDPDGGMARIFLMTDAGSRILAAERSHSHAALSRTLSEWTDPELEDLRRVLRRFNGSIERSYARPWPRVEHHENI